MPRSNRPRNARGAGAKPGAGSGPGAGGDEDFDLSRVLYGRLRVETARDGSWNVQPISGTSASKSYLCPGCGLTIAPGVAHLVSWRADGLMGEADDIAARRHWHTHCWKIR